MTALGPKAEAALKDGPQFGSECPNCHGTGKVMRPAFQRGTGHLIEHGCHICKGHGKLSEPPKEFARRVALIAVEEERERWNEIVKVCNTFREMCDKLARWPL